MSDEPVDGHDGPYDAPLVISGAKVLPEWIDFNGHMNVACYSVVFDLALKAFLQGELGIGEKFATRAGQGPYVLQGQIHYLAEMLVGEGYDVHIRLIDHDAKRLHIFFEMFSVNTGAASATCEQVLMNVDLTSRRSAAYPGWAVARIAAMAQAHAGLDRPAQLGAPLGIRRKE